MALSEQEQRVIAEQLARTAEQLARTTLELHGLHVDNGRVVCAHDGAEWPCLEAVRAARALGLPRARRR